MLFRSGRNSLREFRVRGPIRESGLVETPPLPNPLPARGAREFARGADSIFKQPILDTRPPSRGAMHPRFCNEPARKIRGRGERRVPAAPAAPCAKVESTRVLTADTPEHPAFPHAMVLTVYFVISPVTGLVCHRHRRNDAPPKSPVGQEAPSANLTPASGRQDHTTSPSAGHIIRPRAA